MSTLITEYVRQSSLLKLTYVQLQSLLILPIVLYGCETWFLALREEHKRRGFENRVLMRICGPKRGNRGMEEVAQ
jgi:hypothetical protein